MIGYSPTLQPPSGGPSDCSVSAHSDHLVARLQIGRRSVSRITTYGYSALIRHKNPSPPGSTVIVVDGGETWRLCKYCLEHVLHPFPALLLAGYH